MTSCKLSSKFAPPSFDPWTFPGTRQQSSDRPDWPSSSHVHAITTIYVVGVSNCCPRYCRSTEIPTLSCAPSCYLHHSADLRWQACQVEAGAGNRSSTGRFILRTHP